MQGFSSYYPHYGNSHLALDGADGVMLVDGAADGQAWTASLFTIDLNANSSSEFSLAYQIPTGFYPGPREVSISNGRIALSDRGKVHLMFKTPNGNLQYESTVQSSQTNETYWANDLYNDTLLVGGLRSEDSEEYRIQAIAAVIEKSSSGQWDQTQLLEPQPADVTSFGKQVFLSNDTAVVTSLRVIATESVGHTELEPNYSVFRKNNDGNWQLHKEISHTSLYGRNCLDCDFYADIVWPVKLQGQYLFLPVLTEGGLHYQVHDTHSDDTGYIATSENNRDSEQQAVEVPETQDSTIAYCIDTDGDGWGWTGEKSCQIGRNPVGVCEDADGDRWGWDGQGSCRIPAANECIDTDGDGWGWTGTASC